jgi:hypothetical protein
MFDYNEPSENISELLAFLLNDAPEQYVFRGQTTDYSHLLPSQFRKCLSGASDQDGWLGLDNNKYNAKLSDRDRVKSKVRLELMKILGKGLGNIIAQQYGLGSETIDITEAPEIAAFFATKTYPSYCHYLGSDENPTGVIYRFKKWPKPRHFVHLEDMMSVMSLDGYQGINKVWFRRRVALPALLSRNNTNLLDHLQDYFEKSGAREGDMQTNHARVHFSGLVDIYESILRSDGSHYPDLKVSRMAAQRGGFMYPVVWHWCIHPASFNLTESDWEGEYFATPDLIAIRNSVAVHDLKKCPDLETFYFKHQATSFDTLTREELWPNKANDPLRHFVEDLASKVGAEYLSDYSISVADPEKGLIDPGYYD